MVALLLMQHSSNFLASDFFGALSLPEQKAKIILALIQMTIGLTTSFLVSLLVPARLQWPNKHISLIEACSKWLKPLTAELLRAAAWILFGAVLFLIPGIVFYMFFLFVPYVVIVDPQYQEGKIDALKRSKELVKPHFWYALLFFVSATAVEVGIYFLQGTDWIRNSSPLQLLVSVLTLGFSVYTYIVLFEVYRSLSPSRGESK